MVDTDFKKKFEENREMSKIKSNTILSKLFNSFHLP
jgi:hypothetical protein